MPKKMIRFTKMQGLGNDFMVVDAIHQKISFLPKRIRRWADRHWGVGFDQLLVVERSPRQGVDFFYRIFNADGTEVGQCGNGARCFARFVYDEGLTRKKKIKVATRTGLVEMHLKNKNQVSVNMGIPQAWLEPFKINPSTLEVGIVSIGNPHCVIPISQIDQAPVQSIGSSLNEHARFPEGVNVGFMQIMNSKQIRLRVYERGAGETQACGSGACAAVITGRLLGLLRPQVNVDLPGGRLQVKWEGDSSPVWLTGPAETVFNGMMQQ